MQFSIEYIIVEFYAAMIVVKVVINSTIEHYTYANFFVAMTNGII